MQEFRRFNHQRSGRKAAATMCPEKADTEAAEERMEPAPASPILTASMLASLFGMTETSPKAGVEVSDQSIEIGTDTKSEAKIGSHPIEEGKVSPDEEAPLPLQGSL